MWQRKWQLQQPCFCRRLFPKVVLLPPPGRSLRVTESDRRNSRLLKHGCFVCSFLNVCALYSIAFGLLFSIRNYKLTLVMKITNKKPLHLTYSDILLLTILHWAMVGIHIQTLLLGLLYLWSWTLLLTIIGKNQFLCVEKNITISIAFDYGR